MAVARKQHYMPRFFLAGFTREGIEDGRLHVINLDTGKSWISTPAASAHERDFYRLDGLADPEPLVVEEMLSKVEGRTAQLLREIATSLTLPSGESFLELMFFLAILIARVPRRRKDVSKFFDRFAKQMLKENVASPEKWMATTDKMRAGGLDDIPEYSQWKAVVEKGHFSVDMPQSGHIHVMMQSVERIYPYLAERKWHLLIATDESGEFVCSDNPASLVWSDRRRDEFARPRFDLVDTELTVPLTRGLALRGRFEGMNASVRVSKRTVATVNGNTILRAHQVYAPSEDFVWCRTPPNGPIASREDLMKAITERSKSPTPDEGSEGGGEA